MSWAGWSELGRTLLCMYGNREGVGVGDRVAQPASPPQGICLCFLAAKFLSGGAPKRNYRLLRTASYALLLTMMAGFLHTVRSSAPIQGGLLINSDSLTLHSSNASKSFVPKPELGATKLHKTSANTKLNLWVSNRLTPIFSNTTSQRQSFIKTALYEQHWIIGSGL